MQEGEGIKSKVYLNFIVKSLYILSRKGTIISKYL